MEIGIGIHGEPGRQPRPTGQAAEIAEQLVDAGPRRLRLHLRRTSCMLNGMGGSPLIELYLMYGEVKKLRQAGVPCAQPRRQLHHALDMADALSRCSPRTTS